MEIKVEVEINRFVLTVSNQQYHANLFFYSCICRRIRVDLDPSHRIHRADSRERENPLPARYTAREGRYLLRAPLKFRSIEKCCFAGVLLSPQTPRITATDDVFKWLISSRWNAEKLSPVSQSSSRSITLRSVTSLATLVLLLFCFRTKTINGP